MTEIPTLDEPAFPPLEVNNAPGMTLRDYFAGQVIASAWIRDLCRADLPEAWAQAAYETADAMLVERCLAKPTTDTEDKKE